MTPSHSDLPPSTPRVKEFFLARQPILGRDQNLYAYELLFRRSPDGPADIVDDLSATATVIAHASELGMENVIGSSMAFLKADFAVLVNDFIHFLSPDRAVLEILDKVEVTPELIARITELHAAGFTFALDDVVANSEDLQKLLPWVKIIKIDLMSTGHDELVRLSKFFRDAGKMLVAKKVETFEQFETCMALGFHYFQGFYFAKPKILSGKKLSPSQLGMMRMMALIARDADNADIEKCIKQDASLGLTLLRLVNTPAAGVGRRIDSLGQAVTVLGRRHLHRWLQILLYAEPVNGNHFTSPLLALATTRGKLLELISKKLRPGQPAIADTAFTVGIMSLMDTLFGIEMEKILDQISVVEEVSDALLYRRGFFGDLLKLTEYIERIEEAGPLLPATLKRLQLTTEELCILQVNAFEWCDSISRSSA